MGAAGPSPVQALALALAGCMSVDVVHILERGRQPLRGPARAPARGAGAGGSPSPPARGPALRGRAATVAADKVERAIALSREKYCSVWHSLRQDIEFTTGFEVEGGR